MTDAEIPVQRQLDACNARDIEAFMACWAEDCEYYTFPSQLLAQGAAAVRARHVERFKEPSLFGNLINRIVADDIVVDQETVCRSFPDGPGEVDVLAIYQVAGGRIAKAWFKMGPPRPRAPGSPVLRTATWADAGAVRTLTRAAYAKWVPLIGREPMPMLADYDAAVRRHRIELAHIDGTLAALIETIPRTDHLMIENLAVSPGFQRRGLGRMLLARAEAVAAEKGLPVLRLLTNADFTGNVRLYQNFGYRIDREEPFKGGTAVFMSKRITCL